MHVAGLAAVKSATLVIGVHRDSGLGGPLSGTFNGRLFKLNVAWTNEFNNLFAPIRIQLPVDVLTETNTLRLEPKAGLTITSVHISTDRRRRRQTR